MPYLQGYGLEDASSTALGDASAVSLGEPDLSFNDWLNQLREILLGLVVSVDLPETRAGYALYQLVNELTGKTPPGTDLGTYIADIYSFTQPALDLSSNLNYLMRELDNILAIDIGQVLDAISGVQGAGGHTIEEIYLLPNIDADTIWQWRPQVGDEQMYTLLQDAGRFSSRYADLGAIAVQNAPGFLLTGPWAASDANELPTDYPAVDWSGIAADDTIESYLDTADPAHNWTTDTNTGMVAAESTHANSVGWYWVCRFTPAEFEKLKAATPAETTGAPVWPGIAGVTLGTPVAITGVHDIITPMDGVIITITTPPTRLGQRLLGTEPYDYGIGELAFDDGDGNVEMWQYMGFRTMILTPKSMATAGGCHLRLLGGAEGTLTPWTLSA